MWLWLAEILTPAVGSTWAAIIAVVAFTLSGLALLWAFPIP